MIRNLLLTIIENYYYLENVFQVCLYLLHGRKYIRNYEHFRYAYHYILVYLVINLKGSVLKIHRTKHISKLTLILNYFHFFKVQ